MRPLRGAELALHITVTEFCGHYGNEIVFGPSFPEPIEIVAEIDALTSALNLSTEASKSELMQHVHLAILALPGHEALAQRMQVAHIYGDANPTADAASRGY